MIELIELSRQRALVRQQWFNGQPGWRVGNPYQWVDGDLAGLAGRARGKAALLSYLTAYLGEFPTPEAFRIAEFDDAKAELRGILGRVFRAQLPFLDESEFDHNLRCMAHVRTQDYSFLRTHAVDLPERPVQVDLGPGVGSHALYHEAFWKGTFIAVEAAPVSYLAQKDFFSALTRGEGRYFDAIDAEVLEVPPERIREAIASEGRYSVKHVPSWYFPDVPDGSVDLVSATWMLNEVAPSGLFWLFAHSIRSLKVGGSFYIRDSSRRKPGGHDIDYDQLLLDLGMELVHRAGVTNLVDYYGVPRLYRKVRDASPTWYDIVQKAIPDLRDVCRGGAIATGVTTTPSR